jgi:hypothetical protein
MHPVGSRSGPVVPFELELLMEANRYQRWLVDIVRPHLGNRVLELGSGIGNMSRHLPVGERLLLTEVDPHLARILEKRVPTTGAREIALVDPSRKLAGLFAHERLDTVLSFNVLEHVTDEVAMVRDLIDLLKQTPGPRPRRIVSVVPAHSWAYGEVDRAYGHFRRYTADTFRKLLADAGSEPLRDANFYHRYLNLPGLLGWWLNGKLLRRKKLGKANIRAFEVLCPVLRPADDFLHERLRFPFGNSLLAVYKL